MESHDPELRYRSRQPGREREFWLLSASGVGKRGVAMVWQISAIGFVSLEKLGCGQGVVVATELAGGSADCRPAAVSSKRGHFQAHARSHHP